MIARPLNKILRVLGMSSGVFANWIIRDEFLTNDASPVTTPRSAEPGPGTLVVTQVDGTFAINSDALEFTNQTTPDFADLRFASDQSYARTSGRALVTEIQIDSGDSAYLYFSNESGNKSTLDDIEDGLCFYFEAGGEIHVVLSGGISLAESVGQWSTGVLYRVAIVQFDEGAGFYIKGGAYSDWKLLFVYTEGVSNTLYPSFSNYDADGKLNFFHFWDAPSSNFSPDFQVSVVQFTQSLGGNLVENGGFETWNSSTDAADWVETLSGASTINQESVEIQTGTYAARFDLDGSASPASLSQTLPSVAVDDFLEIQGHFKSAPTGSVVSFETSGELGDPYTITNSYSTYTDTLNAGLVAVVFTTHAEDGANSSIYADNFSVRKVNQNATQNIASDAIIDFEFILPTTLAGSALMRIADENIFLAFYRFVLGLIKALLDKG